MGFAAALPSIVSVGSQLAGLFGGKKRGPSEADIRAMNMHNVFDHFRNVTKAAKESGVHPLYAFGAAQGVPSSNVMLGGQDDRSSRWQTLADAGQNLGTALHRLGNKEERAMAAVTARQAMERGDLENELLKSQIAQIRSTMNPAFPGGSYQSIIPGQGDGATVTVPSQMISNSKGFMHEEAGGTPIYKRFPYGKSGDFAFYGLSQPATETAEGYGHVGGTLFGAGALLGSVPLYIRDSYRAVRSYRNRFRGQFYRKGGG